MCPPGLARGIAEPDSLYLSTWYAPCNPSCMGKRRYIVVGEGAVSCVLGGLLQASGARVTFVARGVDFAALREEGLVVGGLGRTYGFEVKVISKLSALSLGTDDVILLAAGPHEVAGVLEELARQAVPNPAIVCCHPTLATEHLVAGPGRRVVSMIALPPVTHAAPGHVVLLGTPGIVDLGDHPHGSGELSASIAADLEAAGFQVSLDPRMRRRRFGKLLLDLGDAPRALWGAPIRSGALLGGLRREAQACFEAAGIDYAPLHETRARYGAVLDEAPPSRTPVSAESRFLNGSIVELGVECGVPTPLNRGVCALADRAMVDTGVHTSLAPRAVV